MMEFMAKEYEGLALYLQLAHGNFSGSTFTGTQKFLFSHPLKFFILLSDIQHVLNVAQGPSGTLEDKNWDKVYSIKSGNLRF